jgi:hypothetical protein
MSDTRDQTPSTLSGSGGPITVTAPSTLAVGAGQTNLISGVRLTVAGKAAKGETFVVTVMNDNGSINVNGAGGVQISGARPTCITLTGTLAQVNAALATLTDFAPYAGTDTLTVVASDSLGDNTPTLYTPITIASAPVITAPASETVKSGVATRLTGLSFAETNWASIERFTITLTAASGVFTQTGHGWTGAGTNKVTIYGGFSNLNQELKDLSLTAKGAGSIVETVTDSFGNAAAPVSISVSAAAPGAAARFAQAAAGFAAPAAAMQAMLREEAVSTYPLLAAGSGHTAVA